MSYKRAGPKQEQKARGNSAPSYRHRYWGHETARKRNEVRRIVQCLIAAVCLKSLHAAKSLRSVMDLRFLAASFFQSHAAPPLLSLLSRERAET
jgi:hypothetical protein